MEKHAKTSDAHVRTITIEGVEEHLPSGLNTKTLTLAEQIANRIADSIISGQYRPGQRISEQDLADLFSVSRGPIREALRILEKEDFVRILPRRFTEVTKLTPHEVEDIFEVRAALLSLAGKLVTRRITPEVEEQFRWSIVQVEKLAGGGDVSEHLRLVYRLSMLLTESSKNEKLRTMIVSMSRQTLALTHRVLSKPGNRKQWARNWQRLARAILSKDIEGAGTAAHELVAQTGKWVMEEALLMERSGNGLR